MTHKRIEIKKLLKDSIINKTECKENIYVHNFLTFDDDIDFPAIGIYISSEEKIEDVHPRGSIRDTEVNFVIYNRLNNPDNDNSSDIIANQIEEQIANIKIKGFEIRYIKTSYDSRNTETISNDEITVITYSVKYCETIKYDVPLA
ncbi:MAG: hypothetical protein K2X69_10590 [Silvanigrellaceae bacterium]|nr:hypothetical protein [Silvanigrellaceae bacterium]